MQKLIITRPKPKEKNYGHATSNLSQKPMEQNRCHTDKKGNQIFLIYREIQKRLVAKSYMTNGLIIYG